MAGDLQPLDMQFPIVDPQGRPTLYFTKWAQQRQIDITEAITAAQAAQIIADFLAAHPLIPGTGIQLTPDGNISDHVTIHADVQAILDEVTATRGAILYRGSLGWAALLPGTAGWFLQTAGAGADPLWAAASGGGGGSIYNPITNIPTTAAFTLLQGVAGSAVMANLSNSRGVSLVVTGAGAVDRNATLEKNTPGATWTMTAVLLPNVLSRNFVTYGLYVKDSATGRIQAFCLGVSGGAYSRRLNWNTLTSFSGATDQAGFGPEGVGPIWLKLVLDATNLTFFISADSETYIQLFQNAKFSFPAAIDRCGVWLGINQQTAPTGMAEAISVLSFNVV